MTPPLEAAERCVEALNPQQREAALYEGRSLLILAGAGSGKTRTLTCRIAYAVASGRITPHQVLAVTFSNRAAQELRHRISELLNSDELGDAGEQYGWEEPYLGLTFHALGLRILRTAVHMEHPAVPLSTGFTIYDDDDQTKVLKKVLKELDLPADNSDAKNYRNAIGWQKSAGRVPEECAQTQAAFRLHEFVKVYTRYDQSLRKNNAVDFGDLLLCTMQFLRDEEEIRLRLQSRFRWVLVDEFQDTNDVQMALIKLLVGPDSHVAVVGDDDQSIYRWRGARVANILEFPDVFGGCQVIKLEQNYRSKGHILGAANAIISKNSRRHPKRLWTDQEDGQLVGVVSAEDDRQEARRIIHRVSARLATWTPPADDWGAQAPVAVFYRTHAQSLLLEEALRRANIAHRVYGGQRFYDRKEIKDILAYARILENPADDEAFLRVVNVPARKVGKKTVEHLVQRAASLKNNVRAVAQEIVRDPTDRVGKKLKPFLLLLNQLAESLVGLSAGVAIEEIIQQTGIHDQYARQDDTESTSRLENLGALVNAAHDFAREAKDPTLQSFLEGVVLRSQVDDLDDDRPHVALMTLHNAKGLEFDHVFVVGVEDHLLPHINSRDPDEVEEERRLLYVGMTRARHSLCISYARRRQRYGTYQMSMPSPFLSDLPGEHVDRMAGMGAPHGRTTARAPKPPARGDETYYEMEASEHSDENMMGRWVRHSRFGEGRIKKVSGRPGPDAIVVVRFQNGETRKILARFLEPS
jgi:DNA helicase-2/ATP-dependent DNA helicase PcrA